MPVINKPGTAMALVPVPAETQPQIEGSPPNVVVPSRSHRTSLQGLLRFCMETTKVEDSSQNSELQPMDEERRIFLENALKSMTIDVVEELQKQIEILKRVDTITTSNEVAEFTTAFETILDYVDNIDIANDFHKIGGFMILYPCMKCPHPRIRSGGCELLAVLSQNNPYCQQIVLDNEFVPLLLTMIEKDEDITVVTKAIYALSAIVRDNSEGFNQLLHYNGLVILLDIIKRNVEKFIIKATFLLESLCRQHPDLKKKLVNLGYVPCLISLFSTERSPSHEYVLSLLVTLIEDDPEALAECKNSRYNLKEVIHRYINTIKNKEECQEEDNYCKRILHLLNS